MAVNLSPEQVANARLIASIARRLGVDPVLAISTAWTESKLLNRATGDNGTSFGLYQLHQGGELGSHSAAWARNPINNARTALHVFQEIQHQTGLRGGREAAAAQRPADPSGYAQMVQGSMPFAQHVLQRLRGGGSLPARAKGGSQAAAIALLGSQGITPGATMQQPSAAGILQRLQQTPLSQVGSVPQATPNPTAGPSGQSPLALSNGLDAVRRRLLAA